jgi:putative ABC transport system ATP-binding protein
VIPFAMSATAIPSSHVADKPSAEMAVAVSCRGVTKEFGRGDTRVQALRGVDLEIPTNEMSLLVGESGCGKTTLISIIAGLLEPTTGDVEVFGEVLNKLRGGRLIRFRGQNIGFVFQQYNLLPALTAAENAAVPLIIAGMRRAAAVRKAAEMLGRVGMDKKVQAYPHELSGGQQQRVAIARALVHSPRLLVCDEPTAALDAVSGQRVMQLLHDVAVQPGRAVIVVTHDNRVFQYGNRIIRMSDGRIVGVERQQPAIDANHGSIGPTSQ